MHAELGEVADLIGWNPGVQDYSIAVENALVAYGVTTVDQATDIAKLRAAAKVAAWGAAVTSLLTRYDFGSEQQSFRRSQMVATAKTQLARAESEAAAQGVMPGYSVEAGRIVSYYDPYTPATMDDEI